MILEKNIGPYKLFQRTEYSKLQVFDEFNNNISNTKTGKKILNDYYKQIKNKYFNIINGDVLDFYDDTDTLEYVFIPENVKKIEEFAFSESKIKYIYLPSTIECIDSRAFAFCKDLMEISLPESSQIDNWGIFNNCINLKKVNLPKNLSQIPPYTFAGCASLKEIDLPSSIKYINDCAFSGCTALEKITLPDTIYNIGNYAFKGCKNLKEINIPKYMTDVGLRVFDKSGLNILKINHDMPKIEYAYDLLNNTNIEKVIINGNILIDPDLLIDFRYRIKQIDFLGTEEELKKFMIENKKISSVFKDKINIIDENLNNFIESNKTIKNNTENREEEINL